MFLASFSIRISFGLRTSTFALACLAVLSLVVVVGCDYAEPIHRKSWALDGIPLSPASVVVESGTSFSCSGVRCRLLGVKESETEDGDERAVQFIQKWLAAR
jgi:hypothetical protein